MGLHVCGTSHILTLSDATQIDTPDSMRILRTLTVALAAAIAIPAASSAQSAPVKVDTSRVDVTGKWSFSVESSAGNGSPTVTFVQKGDSLKGQYISQALGTHDFSGTIKAGKIAFGFNAESGGQAFSMAFSGVMEDKDSMSGAIDFAGMATGSFAGKRAKP
jgi:hypothetical protein